MCMWTNVSLLLSRKGHYLEPNNDWCMSQAFLWCFFGINFIIPFLEFELATPLTRAPVANTNTLVWQFWTLFGKFSHIIRNAVWNSFPGRSGLFMSFTTTWPPHLVSPDFLGSRWCQHAAWRYHLFWWDQ